MSQREPLMSESYFSESMRYAEQTIGERLRKLRDHPEQYIKPEVFVYANFRDSYQLLLLAYSRGDAIGHLKPRFAPIVEAWEQYQSSANSEINDFARIDDYVVSLWLASLALLLDVEQACFERLLRCVGNEGKDKLFERLVAVRMSGRPPAPGLLWPKPYEALDAALDAGREAPKLMQKFLKSWYSSLKDCYWHDCHKGPKGGGFFGYWCLEAAAAAKAFGIDDASFRDMPCYPKDLVRG
jgi:hypothetical protein